MITLLYNNEFDREHFPIKPEYSQAATAIASHYQNHINLFDKRWFYEATIQGILVSPELKEHQKGLLIRQHKSDMEFLLSMPGFRWCEIINGNPVFAFER